MRKIAASAILLVSATFAQAEPMTLTLAADASWANRLTAAQAADSLAQSVAPYCAVGCPDILVSLRSGGMPPDTWFSYLEDTIVALRAKLSGRGYEAGKIEPIYVFGLEDLTGVGNRAEIEEGVEMVSNSRH